MENSTHAISAVFRILTVIINLRFTTGFPYCPCILFNTTGNFNSPNYPLDLTHIDCLFYHFKAPKDNVIQITFKSFSLPIRNPTCIASVGVFDHSEDGLIDPTATPDFQYCGNEVKSGKQFYSRGEHFLLQIRHGGATSKGFSGEYRFLSKANFNSDAIEMNECSYKTEKTEGMLYSPHYPYFYPSLFNCSYILPQRKGFQIVISSGEIMLGKEALLYAIEISKGKSQILSIISSQHSLYLSSLASIQLYFQAGINHDRARGFVIEFTYEKSVWRSEETNVINDCSLTITSSSEKSGNVSSHRLNPKGSSLPTRCRISFQGFPNERVSVKFTHFNLYTPENKNITKRCAEFDHLTANVRVGSRLSRIDEWCGNKTPPQLMSSTNLLELEYMTKSPRLLRENAKHDIGFRLEYLFHTDWDMQHMQAEVDKSKDCRFLFNSSNQSSGNLWSINYPGLYPRNVYCEYIFHGSDDEIVHIHFEYFDVEGFHQCDETTKSDFILFSNYQTHDRTNRRFCGKIAPKGPILSESNYFRMIFSTNDIFDATGFYAHYQFISQQKAQISRVKLTTSTTSTRFVSVATLLRIAQFLFSD